MSTTTTSQRIHRLPEALINRIAAGEVVERPAAVVKELVENSLDAGAQRIEIELEEGGRRMIRVTDDGCGMNPDETRLALERHATSKIERFEDLDRLGTYGFRGEALPSIAAVSRLRLASVADPDEGGLELRLAGGELIGEKPVARPRGTEIEVRDLFFNVPARRKFLAKAPTELRHAQDAIIAQALASPQVGFILRHGSRTLIDAPASDDLAARLAELEPRQADRTVHRFEIDSGPIRLWGLLARGTGERPKLTLLVNGRSVRDRLLTAAAMRTLREGGSGWSSARLVLGVELPGHLVDINVHPAKSEVRFFAPQQIYAQVGRAVREAIRRGSGQVTVRHVDVVEGSDQGPPRPSLFEHPIYRAGSAPKTEGEDPKAALGRLAAIAPGDDTPPSEPQWLRETYESSEPLLSRVEDSIAESAAQAAPSGARAGTADTAFGRLIGQYRASFILLEDEDGLVVVDQHVAHERVLYDLFVERLREGSAPSQALLLPIVDTVGEARAAALEEIAPVLERVGLEADRFGHDAVRLTATPPELERSGATDLLGRLLDRATDCFGTPAEIAAELEHEIAAMLSCQAAIKVNHPLTETEQKALLRDLASSADPHRCPHGRPIIIRLDQVEMERRLGRR